MNNKLKATIEESGITKKALAKKLDITVQSLNNKLKARTDFNITEAFKLSEILQKDIRNIFFEENNTKKV